MTQDEALTILSTGANVFLTGEPGSGKSYTVNRFVSFLRERGIAASITASTGIAATHVDGMTIHSWSGLGIRHDLSDWDLDEIASKERIAKRLNAAKVLIIDEVSMLDAHTLQLVDRIVRTARHGQEPFGGLQVVFVGDFFQLPPISKNYDEVQFAFHAPVWRQANPIVCYLEEQHRQEDPEFLALLSALRRGSFSDEDERRLRARFIAPESAVHTRLYTHNVDVDQINAQTLAAIDGRAHRFEMHSSGAAGLVETLKRGCLSPEILELKVGAYVMFTRNNFETGYVNGTLGTIESFDSFGMPVVRTVSGKTITAIPIEWAIEDGGKILAKISQVPLRLAAAITVHKSQGMSLDAAVIDLSKAFEYGQGYVALSRVRSLSGLYLEGFNDQARRVHPEISRRDPLFRGASDSAAEMFAALPKDELATMQKNFIQTMGGHEPSEKTEKEAASSAYKEKIEKMREKYPNAYRPWKKEDDVELTKLFDDESSIPALMRHFGRHSGAIRARLVKLGLMEAEDVDASVQL